MKFNLNIKTKLLAGFGSILFLLLIVTLTSFYGIAQLESRVAEAETKEYKMQRANSSFWALRLSQAQFPSSPQLWQRILDSEKPNKDSFYENLKKYKEVRELTSEEKVLIEELETNIAEYLGKRPEIFSLVQAGKVDEANEIRAKFSQPRGFAATKAIDQILTLSIKDDKARKELPTAHLHRFPWGLTVGYLRHQIKPLVVPAAPDSGSVEISKDFSVNPSKWSVTIVVRVPLLAERSLQSSKPNQLIYPHEIHIRSLCQHAPDWGCDRRYQQKMPC